MDAWWTYRPSDFVLFSADAWWRLHGRANVELWPAHLATAAVGVGALVAAAMAARPRRLAGAALLGFAGVWLFVAWQFFVVRFAEINWAASWMGAAFAMQAALLGIRALTATDEFRQPSRLSTRIGVALLAAGVLLHPVVGILAGRPWTQAEVFGIAPAPTALATLGLLLVALDPARDATSRRRRWTAIAWRALLWPIPIAWLVVGATLHATLR